MEKIQNWAKQQGYAVKYGRFSVLEQIRKEFEERISTGELDEDFKQQDLSNFTFGHGAGFVPASVIMVAVPRKAHYLVFHHTSGCLKVPVPPTYLFYRQTANAVLNELKSLLGTANIELLPVPLKTVAAGFGLAVYGRNNITYVAGLGSYHQLVGLVTDLVFDDALAVPVTAGLATACGNCHACCAACPTGAISDKRFLLHAERCLTLLNEKPGEWPAWLPVAAHQCVVGCLACQKVCPLNTGLLQYEELTEAFAAGETATILNCTGKLDEQLTAKLERLGLSGYGSILPRNLQACAKSLLS